MDAQRTISAVIGMMVGLLLGALIITGWNAVRYDRNASDQCWVDGGTYVDGTCEHHIPGTRYDKFKDEGLVCMDMKGSYMVKGEDFKCYGDDGVEKKMPDLTGKKVTVLTDGTVLLQGK